MSKRQFKSQASSGRVGAGLGGIGNSGFGATHSSTLSYIQEPPDYSSISDANVVVAFKNLSKKDGTTKAKALEDLQLYVSSADTEIEDGLLEAWVKLFPRLSIDSARRVRQLAHVLNGQICGKCGKRIAKHMPRLAGPWLAGGYDSDRSAAKAAQDALSFVFPSAEKVHAVQKAFHEPILEYCRDAALHETQQTLSDERTVSPDDAEATYARVVATGLAVITSLLEDLSSDELLKQHHLYEQVLSDKRFWEFASHADASVRRYTHRLVRLCLIKLPELIEGNVKAVSTAYVYKGLPSDQSGSALDFLRTLDRLTAAFPTIWTTDYSGKKSALSRLRQCLKHGSYSGSAEYWAALGGLVLKLPSGVLPQSYEDVADLLSAMHSGVSKREERFTASAAWQSYFTLTDLAIKPLDEEARQKVADSHAMPIIRQYLQPSEALTSWSVTGAKTASIVSQAATVQGVVPATEREWPALTAKLLEMMKTSQPEQSKEFDKSQRQVAAAGDRWCALQRELFRGSAQTLRTVLVEEALKVVNESFALLTNRNGKPYSAAATVDELLRTCGQHMMRNSDIKAAVTDFAEHSLPALLFSPSQRHLAQCLYALSTEASFERAFAGVIACLVKSGEPASSKAQALRTLFTHQTPENARQSAQSSVEFQKLVVELSAQASESSQAGLFTELSRAGVLKSETATTVLDDYTSSLTSPMQAGTALEEMDYLCASNESVVREYMGVSHSNGEQLLPNIIRLEQSQDDKIAELATALSAKLSLTQKGTATGDRFAVVRANLERTSKTSLPIDSLLDLADRLLGPERKVETSSDILPDIDIWRNSVLAVMTPPSPSLAILSPLGGAVQLVRAEAGKAEVVSHDEDGLSQPLRIALYVVRLLTTTDLSNHLVQVENTPGISRPQILALINLTLRLAEDNMSVPGTNPLWKNNVVTDADVLEFISEANAYFTKVTNDTGPEELEPYQRAFDNLQDNHVEKVSPAAYYCSLASCRFTANVYEIHGSNSEQTKASEEPLRRLLKSGDFISLTAHIVGFEHPLSGNPALSRTCNELVADLTGADAGHSQQKVFNQLVTLNAILQTQEDATAMIAKQRLIFLVKHILPWLNNDGEIVLKVEVCKAVACLLPGMQDMYGEHWSQLLSFLSAYWSSQTSSANQNTNEDHLMLEHASLRLYGVLRRLAKGEDPNDDLIDALKDGQDALTAGLVDMLKSANGISDEAHQPLMVTNELLGRQISQLQMTSLPDADELYPLLYTPSHAIQQAAFNLLHKQVPAAQEQISFDAALENKTAQLSDELLSLILEAPTLDSLADASFDRIMPLSLQGYLYSWRLLFDHFDGSSYKVKTDYIEQLKDGAYLPSLLSLAFDFLGHSRGRPVDASKFEVADYEADMEPSPEKDVQWLLTHLYYLALTHVPSLVRSNFLDIRSRQTSLAVESWTAKYISPLIVNTSLQAVADWSEKSVKEDPEYEKMTVKVGMRSKEINVSYIVDEQVMAIKVVLPDAYPLASAQVMGVSRVAVKEEKWQSWLRNCQGVITFSNGSITDGLSAWRKNVTGALKGQTECAICYSIISGDKQLPTKRCPTCKNLFHASCLYKWFKTSNASTCPLCRNAFNFN